MAKNHFYIMDSVKYSIDNDYTSYLSKIHNIKPLFQWGITVFVYEDFPPYHDMTFSQYAIAKSKML